MTENSYRRALEPEELRQQFVRSCAMLGIAPAPAPEPEVLAADLARIQCRTLACLIARLIAENEPLLRAQANGAAVTVRDPDGNVMQFTIQGGPVSDQQAAGSDHGK